MSDLSEDFRLAIARYRAARQECWRRAACADRLRDARFREAMIAESSALSAARRLADDVGVPRCSECVGRRS